MLKNVRILHERNGENGWIVRADTLRFGRQEIMCEGTYDDCMRWVKRVFKNPLVESITFAIDGFDERYGVWFENKVICLHRNGFEKHLDGVY